MSAKHAKQRQQTPRLNLVSGDPKAVPTGLEWSLEEQGEFVTHAVNVVAGLLDRSRDAGLADDEMDAAWWLLHKTRGILTALDFPKMAMRLEVEPSSPARKEF